MVSHSIWILGTSRSGKTTRLVEQFYRWVESDHQESESSYTKNQNQQKTLITSNPFHLRQAAPGVLVLAANDDNRRELADKIATITQGKYPIRAQTVLGFFQEEVILFWPLLVESLQLKAQFPLRLRPETEQELATKLWHSHLDPEILLRAGVNEYRLVRRILDLWQLGAYSGTKCDDIGQILQRGLQENTLNLEPEFLASLLLDWRNWCLNRGLLTYAMITELYHQHLLTNKNYQQRLVQRYQAVLADDVDDYPAIAYHLFELLLDQGVMGAFSYNPNGAVRLGLGADPDYLQGLSHRCHCETLTSLGIESLAASLVEPMVELVMEPMLMLDLPASVQLVTTISRAQLLRQTAEIIINGIKSGQVAPEEVAIIAPGLDAIARYTFMEILTKQNIPIEPLNDQRPLISVPVVRGLLTLVCLVYPGLGRLIDRDAMAEMLVVLSKNHNSRLEIDQGENTEYSYPSSQHLKIDPVRAGLIADYCFAPHPESPKLLPVETFERWDRIGYHASIAYEEILDWLEKQRSRLEQRLIPNPTTLLYLAIQDFLCQEGNPPYEQLAALRELLETAQHYWEIDTRLRQTNAQLPTPKNTLAEFIQLLRRGTITANPYPVRPIGGSRKAVTLATIFQYRSNRKFHRWHFWLDAGSPLWAKGGAATLFGATYFLRSRLGEPWTAEDEKSAEEQRLKRILADLLARTSEKIYLCHSELAVNGQEQLGHFLPLINASEINVSINSAIEPEVEF